MFSDGGSSKTRKYVLQEPRDWAKFCNLLALERSVGLNVSGVKPKVDISIHMLGLLQGSLKHRSRADGVTM